jgi:hypothetical protein
MRVMFSHDLLTEEARKAGWQRPLSRYALVTLAIFLWVAGVNLSKPGSSSAMAQGLKVTHIEVAQVIQDPDNSVKLVARKKNTLARVYLTPDEPGSSPDSSVTLSARLRVVSADGQTFLLDPDKPITINPSRQIPLVDMHNSIDATLNYFLPPEATVAGVATLSLQELQNTGVGASYICSNCPTFNVKATFIDVPTLHVRVLGFSYIFVEEGSMALTPVKPTELDYKMIESWLERTYPTPKVELTSTELPLGMRVSPNSFPCWDALSTVDYARSIELNSNPSRTLQRTHYYGLLKDANGRNFVPGCSPVSDFPNPGVVGAGPTGQPSAKSLSLWKKDGASDTYVTYGDYQMGHELGHSLGRRHPGKCPDRSEDIDLDTYKPIYDNINDPGGMIIGYDFGYDLSRYNPTLKRGLRLIPGNTYKDIMTYCDFVWISKYTYENILDRLVAEGQIYPDEAVSSSVTGNSSSENNASGSLVRQATVVAAQSLRMAARSSATDAVAVASPTPAASDTPSANIEKPKETSIETENTQAQEQQKDAEFLRRVELGDFLKVSGTVNLTERSGKFLAPLRVRRVESRSKAITIKPEGPSLKIQYLNKNGDTLGLYYLPLQRVTSEDKYGKLALVQGVIPVVPEINTLNFILVGGEGEDAAKETLLVSRKTNDSVPKVEELEVIQTQGGPGTTDTSKLPFDVRWSGSDRGRDEVHYIIEYSKDEGKTWITYAPYYIGTSIFLYPNITPDDGEVREVKVRVTAIDGFNKSGSKEFTYKIKK